MKKSKNLMMLSSSFLALALVVSNSNAAVHSLSEKKTGNVQVAQLPHEGTSDAHKKMNKKTKNLLEILEDVSCDGS